MLESSRPARPAGWLSFASVVLPILKCLLCPACLTMMGSVALGARFGFVADEQLHGMFIAFAMTADAVILAASYRHHRQNLVLWLAGSGALLVVFAHYAAGSEALEYAGLALLMLASLWNVRLLLAHRAANPACCHHETGSARQAHAGSLQ